MVPPVIRALLVMAIAVFAASAGTAAAATCDEVDFPDRAKVGSAELVLNGLGLRKATIFSVRVYVAGLYLPQKSSNPDEILGSAGAWRMELRFVRNVGASDIREAWQEGFEKSAADKLAALQGRIDALKAAMTDFKTGERLAFANEPAAGLAVEVNDGSRPPIPGADFSNALLAIWLGPKPPNSDLKAGLLGGKCE